MAGKIRSREKLCPKGHRLQVKEESDIVCPKCHYRPKTYFIFLYWQGDKYRIPRDPDGNVLDSYRRAHRLIEKIRSEIDLGVFSIVNYLPAEIEQFRGRNLFPKWLCTKDGTAPTTYREYKRYTETYFLPFFERIDIRTINAGMVEDFFMWVPKRQAEIGGKHLSEKSLKNLSIALHNFVTWLHRREAITRIPIFPKITPPEPIIECLNRDDQEKILESLALQHRPIFEFMIYHPVRPGEARALRRKHFDLNMMTVHIEEAFSLKEIRCRKSKKDYYLPISAKFDISILKNKLPEAFVFTNQVGRPYKSENIRRIWHRACKKAKVSRIKMYNGCRHSTATDMLKKSGGNLNLVSKALGHSSVKMSEKYARHDVEILRELVNDGAQVVQISEINRTI